MNQPLYHRPDVQLPYNIDNRYFKNISQGEVKEKYECRWVVKTEEANSFIQSVPHSFNGLALGDINRDDRGPITLLTINYGDGELSEDYQGDGQITWWSFGGSVYSFHIKRWVQNTPQKIKQFIQHCLNDYGYSKDQVTVNCNPIAGEPRVMCQATFTPRDTDEWGNNTGGDFNQDNTDQDGIQEQGQSIQFDTSIDSMTVPVRSYISYKLNITVGEAEDLGKLVGRIDNGELVYKKQGQYGGAFPPASGWYLADDNPQAFQSSPEVPEDHYRTPVNVASYRQAKQTVPDATFVSLKVTFTSKVKSKEKLTYKKLSKKFSETGKREQGSLGRVEKDPTDTNTQILEGTSITNGGGKIDGLSISKNPQINVGGSKMTIPANCWIARDTQGHTYPLQCSWLNEGISFDAKKVKSKVSSKLQRYYEGSMVRSYRTLSTFYKVNSCDMGSGQLTVKEKEEN